MAVYTPLANEDIALLLETQYAIGSLAFAVGIAQGVENTNYLIATDHEGVEQKYILTLYEKRMKREELPFFMQLMEHMAAQGIPCPLPVHGRMGDVIVQVKDKPAAIVRFLQGKSTMMPRTVQVASLGAMVARMHNAVQGFSGVRENALSLAGWRSIFEKIEGGLDSIQAGLRALVEKELTLLEAQWPRDLPRGVVHADIFPDNVFYEGDAVSGVIDFYFACEDFFAYDLAIVMNAWCFEGKEFNLTKAQHLCAQYRAVRPLSAQEMEALPVLARGAALRFLLTRAHDWIYRDAAALVTPKDPMEYVKKLEFHQQVKHAGAYGL